MSKQPPCNSDIGWRRRDVITTLTSSMFGIPLSTLFAGDQLRFRMAETTRKNDEVRVEMAPCYFFTPEGAAELRSSEFASLGGFFVRNNLSAFVAGADRSVKFELLNCASQVVYQHNFVISLLREDRLVFQLTALDDRGRSALIRVESSQASQRQRAVRHPGQNGDVPQPRLIALTSMDLSLEYSVPGSATAPAQSESVTSLGVTTGSDLQGVLKNPLLFGQILNPMLLAEMANPLLVVDVFGSTPQVLEARTCLSCKLILGAAIGAAAAAVVAVGAAAAATAAAAKAGFTAASLAASATVLKFASDFVQDCVGACAK